MPHYKFDQIAFNITDKKMPEPGDEKMYIGLEHLDSGSLKITRWGSEVELTGQKLVMRKGDVLFGRRNTYLRRAAIAPHDGIFSAHGMIFRPKTQVIDPEYFPFFISSNYFMDAAIRISVGSLSPTVNWKTLKELEFDLPSLEEQRKNAALLKSINETKEAYQELLIQTDNLVKSQFIEMFDGKFPLVKTEDVCHFITKGTTPKGDGIIKKHSAGLVPYLKVYNLSFDGSLLFDDEPQYVSQETHNGFLARSKVYPGDVLMNIVGPPLGKFALVTSEYPEWNINQAIAIFRAKEMILPEYLLHALMQPKLIGPFIEKAQGVRQMNFSLEQCRKLEIPLPGLDIQSKFVEFVHQSDKSKFELKEAIKSCDALMKAILFTNLEEKEG